MLLNVVPCSTFWRNIKGGLQTRISNVELARFYNLNVFKVSVLLTMSVFEGKQIFIIEISLHFISTKYLVEAFRFQ